MNCHYIRTQLERIQAATVGTGDGLSYGGAIALEQQLRAMEAAISRIRDEMRRRKMTAFLLTARSPSKMAATTPAIDWAITRRYG
jgi:hypothetical protein